MKVLTVWSGVYAGGAARRFVELVDGLSDRGVDVLLLTGHSYPHATAARVEHLPLPQGRFRVARTLMSRPISRRVRAWMQEHRPQAAFAFGLANGGVLCRAAREQGIPSVLFVRGMELVLTYNRSIPLHRVPLLGRLVQNLYSGAFRAYSRSIFRTVDAIVFQHREQYRAYVNERMIDQNQRQPVYFLPNNSNPSWVRPNDAGALRHEPVTVMAANLFWNKGFEAAFDAFQTVRRRVPDARLVVLGDGPEGDEIRRAGAAIGGVEFKGHIADIHHHLCSARLFLHPTLSEMGSPNAVLEAAAHGIAMVVSDEVSHTVASGSGVYPRHDTGRLTDLWTRALGDDGFLEVLRAESKRLGDAYRFDWVGRAHEILARVGTKP